MEMQLLPRRNTLERDLISQMERAIIEGGEKAEETLYEIPARLVVSFGEKAAAIPLNLWLNAYQALDTKSDIFGTIVGEFSLYVEKKQLISQAKALAEPRAEQHYPIDATIKVSRITRESEVTISGNLPELTYFRTICEEKIPIIVFRAKDAEDASACGFGWGFIATDNPEPAFVLDSEKPYLYQPPFIYVLGEEDGVWFLTEEEEKYISQ